MAIVLCISSQTARGYIGGSAARVALERLGHQVWLLPSVVLSNHPGHAVFAGEQVPPGRLRAMLDALKANGWIDEIDAVLTGYLPTPEHVRFAESAIALVREANPDASVLCDPIMGDDPGGLYVNESAAAAIRDTLLAQATLITPNRFELAWLSGQPVESVQQAIEAAAALPCAAALVTSLPGATPNTIRNLLCVAEATWETMVPERPFAPHGAGDLLAALHLGHRLNGAPAEEAFGRAAAGVGKALDASGMADELQLVADPAWAEAQPLPATRIA